jgi:hypothetical protein
VCAGASYYEVTRRDVACGCGLFFKFVFPGMFSFDATKSHWAVTTPVTVTSLCIFVLIFLLLFYCLASLPQKMRSRLQLPWEYAPNKATLMFCCQVVSIPFAIGACLCILFSYFIEDQQQMPACNALQVGIAGLSLTMELLQSVFLLQKAKATQNVWGNRFLLFYRILYVYVLISFPIIIVLMMVYIQGAWIASDDGAIQVCGAVVPMEIAGFFASNSILTNGSLLFIFYRSIAEVAANVASDAKRASPTGAPPTTEGHSNLMIVARRNLVSFCLISCSMVLFMTASIMPGGDIGLVSEGYLPFHFLFTNLIILYCTQAAWKKKDAKNKSAPGSTVGRIQNVSTKPSVHSLQQNHEDLPEKQEQQNLGL